MSPSPPFHTRVRVARESVGGLEVGFTVLMTHLPKQVQEALDSGEMELHYASDGKSWFLALTPVGGKGLYSAAETNLRAATVARGTVAPSASPGHNDGGS